MLRVVISGGGTGGHIYPAIAIAKAIMSLEPRADIVFIGGRDRLEANIIPGYGFKFVPISVEGLPRSLTWRWASFGFKVPLGFLKAVRVVRKFRPHVVVGTGGYVSGPVILAGLILKKPTIIQEQNAAVGLTNKILARWVDEVHLGFAAAAAQIKAKHLSTTGNPIRAEITKMAQMGQPRPSESDRTTIFVMGGSLGAHSINVAMVAALKELSDLSDKVMIVHQTGAVDYKEVKAAYENFSFNSIIRPYFNKIEEIYRISDLMVCRAGGMTIAEITACGLPAILIPYPFAIGDHQKLNARAMAEQGAAVIIDNMQLDGKSLAKALKDLIADDKKLKEMADASKKLGKPNAAVEVAKTVLEMANRKG